MRTLLLCLLLGAGPVFAADGAGTSSAVFLTLPADPVSAALGGISVPGRASPLAVLSDPAALSGVTQRSAEFSHAFWLEDISYNTLAAAAPYRGGTAAFGLRYLRYGAVEALDNTGAAAGSFSPRDASFSAGWGTRDGDWSAGAAVKYVNSRIAASADAFSADGALGYSSGRFSAGAALQNLGGELKFGRESYPLPMLLRVGGSYLTVPGLRALLEGVVPRSGPGWLAAGAEYPVSLKGTSVALRCGYSSRYIDTGGFNGLTAGLGLASGDLTFDYAFTAAGELGTAHQFGIGLRWGGGDGGDDAEKPGMLLSIPG